MGMYGLTFSLPRDESLVNLVFATLVIGTPAWSQILYIFA